MRLGERGFGLKPTPEGEANASFARYKSFEGVDPNGGVSGGYLRPRSEPVLARPCRTWHCYAETELSKEQVNVTSLQSLYGYTWTELHPLLFDEQIL